MRVRVMLTLACIIVIHIDAKTKILLTAALTDSYYSELRKLQYITSFQHLANYGYGYHDFYIVESLQKNEPTFLDSYCKNVLYSQLNSPDMPVGYNEITTLLDALYYFNFDPDDIIIKLTGRHSFYNNTFIKQAENMTCDALFRHCSKVQGTFYTVAFAMRCDRLIDMCEWIKNNFLKPMNLEHHVCLYCAQAKNLNLKFVNRLYVRCNTVGSLSWPGQSTSTYNL